LIKRKFKKRKRKYYSNNHDFVPFALPTVTYFETTLPKVALRYGTSSIVLNYLYFEEIYEEIEGKVRGTYSKNTGFFFHF